MKLIAAGNVCSMGLFDRFKNSNGESPQPPRTTLATSDTVAEREAGALLELARTGAPLERQRAALTEFLQARGLAPGTVAAVLARTRDGIALEPDPLRGHTTRIGGEPLLPAGEDWPLETGGAPLTFIAALDLDELPALAPLPSGMLLVYWDEDCWDREREDFVAGTRVFHVPSGGATVPARRPDGAPPSQPVALAGFLMPLIGEIEHVLEHGGAPPDEVERLFAAADPLFGIVSHQLLGSSQDIQGPVLDEVARWLATAHPQTRRSFRESELRGEGWLLLAQFAEEGDLVFGDAGVLYLVMPRDDLPACRFDRVMGIMQCH
jgi:hypothetical protein